MVADLFQQKTSPLHHGQPAENADGGGRGRHLQRLDFPAEPAACLPPESGGTDPQGPGLPGVGHQLEHPGGLRREGRAQWGSELHGVRPPHHRREEDQPRHLRGGYALPRPTDGHRHQGRTICLLCEQGPAHAGAAPGPAGVLRLGQRHYDGRRWVYLLHGFGRGGLRRGRAGDPVFPRLETET